MLRKERLANLIADSIAPKGDKIAAEKAWRAVLEIGKDSPLAGQAHFSLAGVYRERGDFAKADAEMKALDASMVRFHTFAAMRGLLLAEAFYWDLDAGPAPFPSAAQRAMAASAPR